MMAVLLLWRSQYTGMHLLNGSHTNRVKPSDCLGASYRERQLDYEYPIRLAEE
jgi:hypothetical protein